MALSSAIHEPSLSAKPETTVMQACELMLENNRGAVAVVDSENILMGIFTERDVMRKVVAQRLDADKTPLRDVMTSPCFAMPSDRGMSDAIALMVAMKINHLAVVGKDNRFLGMVSYRTLLGNKVEEMNSAIEGLQAYAGQDSLGGE